MELVTQAFEWVDRRALGLVRSMDRSTRAHGGSGVQANGAVRGALGGGLNGLIRSGFSDGSTMGRFVDIAPRSEEAGGHHGIAFNLDRSIASID